jgi:hypothetical protein
VSLLHVAPGTPHVPRLTVVKAGTVIVHSCGVLGKLLTTEYGAHCPGGCGDGGDGGGNGGRGGGDGGGARLKLYATVPVQ